MTGGSTPQAPRSPVPAEPAAVQIWRAPPPAGVAPPPAGDRTPVRPRAARLARVLGDAPLARAVALAVAGTAVQVLVRAAGRRGAQGRPRAAARAGPQPPDAVAVRMTWTTVEVRWTSGR